MPNVCQIESIVEIQDKISIQGERYFVVTNQIGSVYSPGKDERVIRLVYKQNIPSVEFRTLASPPPVNKTDTIGR